MSTETVTRPVVVRPAPFRSMSWIAILICVVLLAVLVAALLFPWAAAIYNAKVADWSFSFLMTSRERAEPMDEMAGQITDHQQMMYEPPQPQQMQQPVEPTLADSLVQAIQSFHSQPVDRMALSGVFMQASRAVHDTHIGTDEELGRFIAVNAKSSLGTQFDAWAPFFDTWSTLVSEMKLQGRLGENDMPNMEVLCRETANLLANL